MSVNSDARLQVRGLTVDYRDVRAVDGVDLNVGGAGRGVVALLGPSGCGKSTLLRGVAGIEPLTSGSVVFDGEDVTRLPAHRRGFGLLFQDGQLFPHRTVAGNIGYGLSGAWGRPRGTRAARHQRVEELLVLVGLEGLGGRRVGELSGGQAQRVALARALAPRPRMLLLDEPLSALDRELRDRLALDIGRILAATGTPALVVTHDHGEASTLAGTIAVMRGGRLVQEAAPRKLWRHPRDEATARFLGYPLVLDGDVRDGIATCALGRVPVAHPDGPVRLGLRAESLRACPTRGGGRGAAPAGGGQDAAGTVESVTVLPSRTLVSVCIGAGADGAVSAESSATGPAGAGSVLATWTANPEGGPVRDGGARGRDPVVGEPVALRPVPGMVAVIMAGSVREVAAGAVIRGGRVLLAQRAHPPALDGLWEFPGGKAEPGESGPEALRRELHEELGVAVRVGDRLDGEVELASPGRSGHGGPMLLRTYLATVASGEPRAAEHRALHWAVPEDLDRMPLVDNDRLWIPALQELLRR
ncbi:ATP-binding cassette domain-containing protein [Tomitella cavernea]|uniref:ATP-binding cassette domain-containing protein n=1 Tax=Tomitella cavernea TaxID=1387982 RepID=A0ABP9CN13_9ACTN|nr:ATP-binding cassette domain-containing protein [Tomitella cavernea]